MTKIIGRDVSPSNKITWVPAEGIFPMKHSISGSRLAGTVALLIGSLWISFFVDDIFKALVPKLLLSELLMMVLFTLPGILVLIYGVSQYIYYEETTIDQKSILWKRRGLIGKREWREAISNYQGVLKEHLYWRSERRSSYMMYLIRIVHADYRKEVVLYRADSRMLVPPADWLEKWKQYGRLLELPVMEKTESGMSSSDISDLEKPLINKIRDGKLKVVNINPLDVKLGLMVKLERDDDDLWIITCYPVWPAWKSIAGTIILVGGLLGTYAYGLIDPKLFRYLLLIVPVCMIAIGLSMRKHIAHPEQLALDKKCVYYRYWNKRKGWVTEDIPLHSIIQYFRQV